MTVPTQEAKFERARSLCSRECWTIRLQVRRLRTSEPEDDTFIFRWWADLQFLIITLRRLRRAASIVKFDPIVGAAIAAFDLALPDLAQMRNVGEHVDSYAINDPTRHHKHISRRSLQVGSWGDPIFTWLNRPQGPEEEHVPLSLNVEEAIKAADRLFVAVRSAAENT